MKGKFKLGDKVYHINYGWGEIIDLNSELKFVQIKFKNDTHSFIGFDLISFTEYTLEGFSQERVELPEVGELCLVRDSKGATWHVRKFQDYHPEFALSFETDSGFWGEMKRIKILD